MSTAIKATHGSGEDVKWLGKSQYFWHQGKVIIFSMALQPWEGCSVWNVTTLLRRMESSLGFLIILLESMTQIFHEMTWPERFQKWHDLDSIQNPSTTNISYYATALKLYPFHAISTNFALTHFAHITNLI